MKSAKKALNTGKGISYPYVYKTPDLCKKINKSRITLWTWEKEGRFTPPRNGHGDRMFTQKQLDEIIIAFKGGRGSWHYKGED
jgi:hypothetical protein